MANLINLTDKIKFKLYPYRFSDDEEPVWISTEICFQMNEKNYVADTISLTKHDLNEIIEGINKISKNQNNEFYLINTDDNFEIKMERVKKNKNMITVIFRCGENLSKAKEYTFFVSDGNLKDFLISLEEERCHIRPKGSLI